jgi:hypothetical protein
MCREDQHSIQDNKNKESLSVLRKKPGVIGEGGGQFVIPASL